MGRYVLMIHLLQDEFERYENIWQENDIRRSGTGNMASKQEWTGGVSNELRFS